MYVYAYILVLYMDISALERTSTLSFLTPSTSPGGANTTKKVFWGTSVSNLFVCSQNTFFLRLKKSVCLANRARVSLFPEHFFF